MAMPDADPEPVAPDRDDCDRPDPSRARRSLSRDEDGAAYTLSYVLTLPLYTVVICLIVQGSLMLVVKMGTVYASFAAARAATVWQATGPGVGESKARLAAVNAMAPFADSAVRLPGGVDAAPASRQAGDFLAAYRAHGGRAGSADYLARKYLYARLATGVRAEEESATGEVAATVRYEMPLRIPIVARLLGRPAPWPGARFSVYAIASTSRLPSERPRNDEGALGIDYVPE